MGRDESARPRQKDGYDDWQQQPQKGRRTEHRTGPECSVGGRAKKSNEHERITLVGGALAIPESWLWSFLDPVQASPVAGEISSDRLAVGALFAYGASCGGLSPAGP